MEGAVYSQATIEELFEITHVRFLKGRAVVSGTKSLYYPPGCVARVGFTGLPEILRNLAATLINTKVCEPDKRGVIA